MKSAFAIALIASLALAGAADAKGRHTRGSSDGLASPNLGVMGVPGASGSAGGKGGKHGASGGSGGLGFVSPEASFDGTGGGIATGRGAHGRGRQVASMGGGFGVPAAGGTSHRGGHRKRAAAY